jgi:hypothetical protein
MSRPLLPTARVLGVAFETATPFETPGWMKEIVEWFNQSVQEENHHPLILIGIFIVVFLAIHPVSGCEILELSRMGG